MLRLRIKGKRCRPKRLLTSWSTGAETAAETHKAALPSGIASVAAGTALDEMEGGNEAHNAYMTAYAMAKPVTNAVDAGRNLYRSQAAKAK